MSTGLDDTPATGPEALAEIRRTGKRALANALAEIETSRDTRATAALLDCALQTPQGFSLGLTGPPGVGKSTLTDALIRAWRAEGKSVGVIAVDPSSTRTGGALLGDRTRLTTDPGDPGVFIRSMAARDRLGGIAEITYPAMVLMRALYDLVVVETVGVGQSEVAISEIADMTAFCAQPGSGDALQFMKAGIMEVPDLVVVTKADMGILAERAVADLKGALSLAGSAEAPVLSCSARDGDGVAEVLQEICTIAALKMPKFSETRSNQAIHWAEDQIRVRFGRVGLDLVHSRHVDKFLPNPFSKAVTLQDDLFRQITAVFL